VGGGPLVTRIKGAIESPPPHGSHSHRHTAPRPALLLLLRDAALAALSSLGSSLCQHAVPLVMPVLLDSMSARNWQTKEAALKLLKDFVALAPEQVTKCLPEIVPPAGECLIDPREQVGRVEEGTKRGTPERMFGAGPNVLIWPNVWSWTKDMFSHRLVRTSMGSSNAIEEGTCT